MRSVGDRISALRQSRRIGALKGLSGERQMHGLLPLRPRGPPRKATVPEEIAHWLEVVTVELAMKAYRLRENEGVDGTLPELLCYEWLRRQGHQFDFQTSLMGGRLAMGGAVADFILFDIVPGGLSVWRIQGDYWHSKPERVERDQLQRERLLTERFGSEPVLQVVDIWESTVYATYPDVFEAAEVGVEWGRRAT